MQSYVGVPGAEAARILLVEDDDAVRGGVAKTLVRLGYDVVQAASGGDALALLRVEPFDAVCSDLQMPGVDGMTLLRAVRHLDLDVPVVLFTGWPSVATAASAVRYGAVEYLTKPVVRADLERAMVRAVSQGRRARAQRGATPHGAGDQAGLVVAFERALQSLGAVFQPVLTRNGHLYGQATLLQTREPALPYPEAVIDAAEALDRASELSRHLWALAAAALAEQPMAGCLFVDLTPRDLLDPELMAEDSPLRPIAAQVVLSITRSVPLPELERIRARVRALRAAGYRIAMAYHGEESSGLMPFTVLSPEVVKLDLALVSKIESSPSKKQLVNAMVDTSHCFGMLVLAEGIETELELEAVRGLGCDLIQGDLFAPPGPAFPGFQSPLQLRTLPRG